MSSRSRAPPPKIEGMTSLKIDNLSARTGPAELRRAFEKFGEIGDIHIPRDRWTRDSRGFAFVRFHSRRDAEEAMARMDGRRVDGRQVHIVMARYGRPIDDRERESYRRRLVFYLFCFLYFYSCF
ncbi:Serine/arginine-rich splicing factor 2 [Trichinella pseudospiralis]|uniref:Serine/arginine-rich splicing factor 2 n=1 Tax=Trichinella pseudospiralis TaxID=6337 RepID=A0A0V0Y9F6_TRIPS|nr:Serine/arginine-rich splicing factor 2 [Trichinella pseudospiralis]